MPTLAVLILAVGVSIDALAVSVGGALCDRSGRRFRNARNAALFFGGFQMLMPIIGYFAATLLAGFLAAVDHWVAFLLLGLVGGKMIREGILLNPQKEEEKKTEDECGCNHCPPDFFAPKALFIPAVATSLDALAVGAGLAFAGNEIWTPALAMGVITALASAIGVLLGRRIGMLAGERVMMITGGSAIVLIGLKILLEHLGIL